MSEHAPVLPCINNLASNEDTHTCDWCASMLDYRPEDGWHVPLSDEEHEEAIGLFGGHTLPSRRRWSHLSNRLGNSMFVDWARLEGGGDPIEALPCSTASFKTLTEDSAAGKELTPEQRRWLNEGILLNGGLCLRYMGDEWYLNDVGLGHHLQFQTVLDVLSNEKTRYGWDVSKLLTGLSALHVTPPDEQANHAPHFLFRGQYHRLINPHHRPIGLMLTWLALDIRVQRSRDGDSKGAMSALAWAYDFKASTTDNVRQTHPQRLVEEAFSNRPSGLFEDREEPWMHLWQDEISTKEEVENMNYPLVMGGRRLKMRVRMSGKSTRLVLVPNQPDLWALLLSWAFSPLMSHPGRLLLGVQHNWSRPYFKRGGSQPEVVRSLEFCHGILNSIEGSRVAVENDRVLIIGKLGHVYEVRVGDGQHGAPYQIRHLMHFQNGAGDELCIHSGERTSSVPIGDTLGSVLLSLYNDTVAARHIESLAVVLLNTPPLGFPEEPNERWCGMLDKDAVREVNGLRDMRGGFMGLRAPGYRWFQGRRGQSVEEGLDEEREARMFHGLIRRHNRGRGRRRGRRWVDRFQAALDSGDGLPYDDVVTGWRASVEPYEGRVARGRRHRWERGLPRRHQMDFRRAMRIAHRHNGDMHQIGDGRDGERRWCEAFSRVWGLLLHQPIGSWVDVPRANHDALSFQHAELRLSVRSQPERRFVHQMIRWCGYVAEGEIEGSLRFRRRDHPQANARMQVCEALGKLQKKQGVRGAPPRWWNYAEPFAAPGEMGALRWPFHEDLTDDQNQQRGRQELIRNDFPIHLE